jgi:hypothetical protein
MKRLNISPRNQTPPKQPAPRVPFRSIATRKLSSPLAGAPPPAGRGYKNGSCVLRFTSLHFIQGNKKVGWFGIHIRRASGTAAEGSPAHGKRHPASLSSSLPLSLASRGCLPG